MERVYEATERDRERLREPRGEICRGEELRERLEGGGFDRLIAVGDRVSLDLSRWGIETGISIVDGRIQRKEIPETELDSIEKTRMEQVYNPAGSITRDVWRAVRECVARECTSLLRVNGEEDLLALPAITFASPGSRVVYGQRDEGAVVLEVDRELKGFVEDLLGVRQYERVIVGGSWEHLHCGHRSLLLEAFARGERVDVGVTADGYMREKLGDEEFQDFSARKKRLERFLRVHGLEDRARILQIDGYRGNAVEEGDALVVTGETVESAQEINRERVEKGREPLDIVEVPLVEDERGRPVSSTRIREGEIDGDGRET